MGKLTKNPTTVAVIGLEADAIFVGLVAYLAEETSCQRQIYKGNVVYHDINLARWGVDGSASFVLLGRGKPCSRVQSLRVDGELAAMRFSLVSLNGSDDWVARCCKTVRIASASSLVEWLRNTQEERFRGLQIMGMMETIAAAMESNLYPATPKYHVAC